jgi:uncharacterized membrane protein YfcA
MDLAAVIGIGVLAGFFIGSVGVGGVIVAPALAYCAGIDIHLAIAGALMGFALSGLVGSFRYGQLGSIQWASVWILMTASVPAAIAGAVVTQQLSALLLKCLIGVAVMSAGGLIIFGRQKAEIANAATIPASRLASIGAVTAFASVVTGTGGPLVLIPLLIWQQVPVLAAIGLGQVIQVPISIGATSVNLSLGAIDLTLGGVLALGLGVGCWFGASVAHHVRAKVLRLAVAHLLLAIGIAILADVAVQSYL